jgi:hypothetical protein
MKLTTFIVLMYVALLTVKPVAEQFTVSLTHSTEMAKMNCCKTKSKDDTKHPSKNCCDKEGCTAIGASCHCCLFFIQPQTSTAFTNPTPKNERIVSVSSNFISSYISDCFHPPQIA